MADRAVIRTDKDVDGDITTLCYPGEYWSPRLKQDAIYDIESGDHTYYVPWKDGRTEIRVVKWTRRGQVSAHGPRWNSEKQPRRPT